mgnify:CR=1 FL=1
MSKLLPQLESFNELFLIAEAGVNHEGSLETALRMVEGAASAGASAIKFQAYTADGIAHKQHAKSYWDRTEENESSQYNLFKKYETFSKEEWEVIRKSCVTNKIEFWLSIFETKLVESLGPLCDGLKVASGDITFKRLHEEIFRLNKPTIFSLGAANHNEIIDLENKCIGKNYATLMCRLIYPTDDKYANYINYKDMKNKYKSIKGISDHCREVNSETILMSYLLGASILEKHFTLDTNLKGNDHYHSCTPSSLKKAMESISRMKIILGSNKLELPLKQELPARKGARRSLYLTKDLTKDQLIEPNDLIELRPCIGICASKINNVIGKYVNKNMNEGDLLTLDDIRED